MSGTRRCGGFTLIEVLVALGIVAVALLRQTLAMLGQICAENALIDLRLLRQLPNTGTRQSECVQAGYTLQVQLQVQTTPNPNFRRVDARVSQQGVPVLQLSTVMGSQ